MMTETVINILNTLCLVAIFVAALLHLNTMNRETAGCERFGFALTAAGAFGHALGYWWPWGGTDGIETIFHLGLGLVAISIARGDLRSMIATAGIWPKWDGHDRRGTK